MGLISRVSSRTYRNMSDEEVKQINTGVGDLDLAEKKKKKKKPKAEDDGADLDLDLASKKKKKKKTKGDEPELDLGEKKKKKKPKTDENADEDAGGDDAGDGPKLDLGKKKKAKTKTSKNTGVIPKERLVEEIDEEKMASFQYDTLLFRVFDRMENMGVGKGAKGNKRI